MKQEKEIKGIQVGKEKVMLPLFGDNMMIYKEDTQESTKKLLYTIN